LLDVGNDSRVLDLCTETASSRGVLLSRQRRRLVETLVEMSHAAVTIDRSP
jgi:hypothetical protein